MREVIWYFPCCQLFQTLPNFNHPDTCNDTYLFILEHFNPNYTISEKKPTEKYILLKNNSDSLFFGKSYSFSAFRNEDIKLGREVCPGCCFCCETHPDFAELCHLHALRRGFLDFLVLLWGYMKSRGCCISIPLVSGFLGTSASSI